MTKNGTAASTQTIIDLSLQLMGSADQVFDLIANNPTIENIESDPTGKNISYDINGTFAQKYYMSKGINVSTKPARYYNEAEPALKCDTGYLTINNGYKLIL
jgi:hypothetical protein